jgi:hypothetical protein
MFEGQIIPGYRHQPGFHCASSAIRNVLAFRGIQVSEPTVIGLGRGPGFFYQIINHHPSRLVHMRHLDLEENFFRTVGLKFQWQETGDAAEATRLAKASVDRGLPVLIQTDIAYLPYFNTDQHFPGHAVVICGFGHPPSKNARRGNPRHGTCTERRLPALRAKEQVLRP